MPTRRNRSRKRTPSPKREPESTLVNSLPPPPNAQDVSYDDLIKALDRSPSRVKKIPVIPGAPKKPKRGGRRTLKKKIAS
jgi:hypothetical protein